MRLQVYCIFPTGKAAEGSSPAIMLGNRAWRAQQAAPPLTHRPCTRGQRGCGRARVCTAGAGVGRTRRGGKCGAERRSVAGGAPLPRRGGHHGPVRVERVHTTWHPLGAHTTRQPKPKVAGYAADRMLCLCLCLVAPPAGPIVPQARSTLGFVPAVLCTRCQSVHTGPTIMSSGGVIPCRHMHRCMCRPSCWPGLACSLL